ncbi:hypothetical protein ACQPYA_10205 [Micromonospora sp. CA-263727]|uniref:hypothetical protein n=1 Tax=Micromonospora sp. CA-263727 TaxID=3239967 RepID=UPI003D8FA0FD
MSRPTPDARSSGKLTWASDDLRAHLAQQVQPQVSMARRLALTAIPALVFTGLPAFVLFAVTTVVAPSATDGASVGTAAWWALQFAVLMAVTAMVTALRRRADEAELDESTRSTSLRVALNALLTGACGALVLALHGLSTAQIAPLAVALVVLLHLLPLMLARRLRRRRERRQAGPSAPTP